MPSEHRDTNLAITCQALCNTTHRQQANHIVLHTCLTHLSYTPVLHTCLITHLSSTATLPHRLTHLSYTLPAIPQPRSYTPPALPQRLTHLSYTLWIRALSPDAAVQTQVGLTRNGFTSLCKAMSADCSSTSRSYTHTMVLHPRPHLRGVLTIEHRRRTPELDKPSKRRHKEHKTAAAYRQNSNTDIGTYAEPKQFERPGGAVEKNN